MGRRIDGMVSTRRSGWRLETMLLVLIAVLGVVSLVVGPAGLSPRTALAGLLTGEGPAGRPLVSASDGISREASA